MHVRTAPAWVGLLLLLATGCGSDAQTAQPDRDPPHVSESPTATATATPDQAYPSPTRTRTPEPRPKVPTMGVDVSHHKGEIDWRRVRGHGISFAYIKATEGTGFTDPRFATNLRGARAAGIRAGGYHYFTLCGAGAPQAEHYLSVIGDNTTMPPALDVEFNGNCNPGPPRDELLQQLRAWIDAVERRTGERVVVYLYPDVEEHYRISEELDRRQWVRSLDGQPKREWWIWQKSDSARIDGISSPADLNQMR